MALSRPSLESLVDQDKNLSSARSLQQLFADKNLKLLNNVHEFNELQLDSDGQDSDDVGSKDPAIVAADVAAQIAFLRKLKFQYLEQNAKDKYVKSIVSDIDDAPIVTAEDNKQLAALNEQKKARLKVAKGYLAELQQNIRTLAPMVEADLMKEKEAAEKATTLAQKIIDARLALTRLRQMYPHPRFTVPMADQKLIDQVTEMQNLSDEVQGVNKEVQTLKDRIKKDTKEIEKLRTERAEVEKAASRVEEDDPRLVPLYDWYTASLSLHRSLHGLHESHSVSENELRLTYNITSPPPKLSPRQIDIILIFAPDTRHLAAARVDGLEDLGVDAGEVIDAHVQVNDIHELIPAVLALARASL